MNFMSDKGRVGKREERREEGRKGGKEDQDVNKDIITISSQLLEIYFVFKNHCIN